MRLLKKCILGPVVAAIVAGCAHSPSASSPSARVAVLRAVTEHVLEARQAEIPEIDPAPLTTLACGCETREAWLRSEFPPLQPSTLENYCRSKRDKLTQAELRSINPVGVMESRVGRPKTPLQFSAVGLSSDQHQALACVRELAEDVFYLLDERNSAWQVTASTVAVWY